MLKKEELDEFLKIKGRVKGVFLQTDFRYILEREGEIGLLKLEKEVDKLGYDLNYKEARAFEWRPVGLRIISLLLIKEVFGYNDNDFREMGRMAAKFSFIIKLFVKFSPSLKKIIDKSPQYYSAQYDVGALEVVKFDEKNKETILRIKNFKIHPLICLYLEGYFQGIAELAVKTKASCKEIKCIFKGDPYNEYKITW